MANHAQTLRYPARGGRHQLHEATRASSGARSMHEAAFLAHKAVYPSLIQVELLRVILYQLAVGSRVTQAEVVQDDGPLRCVDRTFVPVIARRQHGCSEQLFIVIV